MVAPVAVGQEVDAVPDPHRVEVVRVVSRDLGDRRVSQFGDPHGRRRRRRDSSAPAGRRPGNCGLFESGHVGDPLAVRARASRPRPGAKVTPSAARRRRGRRTIARTGRNSARRAEDHGFAVGGPADRHIGIGVVGQTAGNAAGSRHDVDVEIALRSPRQRRLCSPFGENTG